MSRRRGPRDALSGGQYARATGGRTVRALELPAFVKVQTSDGTGHTTRHTTHRVRWAGAARSRPASRVACAQHAQQCWADCPRLRRTRLPGWQRHCEADEAPVAPSVVDSTHGSQAAAPADALNCNQRVITHATHKVETVIFETNRLGCNSAQIHHETNRVSGALGARPRAGAGVACAEQTPISK